MTEYELLSTAYISLLHLPHGRTRINLQSTLASVRDEIARLTEMDSEDVQNHFEAIVYRGAPRTTTQ